MEIVSACLARDLPVYRLTYQSLRKHLPGSDIHVVTKKKDFSNFKNACGKELTLWDEADLVPNMNLEDLRNMPLPFFPMGAGWYFQQFLKFAFVNVANATDKHFLIWDADTVLLRPIRLFNGMGLPYYTMATEYHFPYFETFEAIFSFSAKRDFSFISQHQIINKSILREMLSTIEQKHTESNGWAWAIMNNLRGRGSNLFSEYETYGHYMKSMYPESFVVRNLDWTRNGGKFAGNPPRPDKLEELSKRFEFAAFEASHSLRRRLTYKIKKFIGIQ